MQQTSEDKAITFEAMHLLHVCTYPFHQILRTRLHIAAGEGQYEEVKRLVKKGAGVDIEDKFGVNTVTVCNINKD